MTTTARSGEAARRSRDYLPLATAGLLMLLLLAVLPSTLNLPQSAPTEQLEFAPVPPQDDRHTPPAGNLSSLSLAGSNSFRPGARADADLGPGGEIPGGRSKNPSTKRCVGDPPRQSEDPLSPPCVSFFEGENHGATYHGVSRDEVQVLFYVNCCISYVGGTRGREQTPENTYVDLGKPPEENEHAFVRALRLYQRHFNERYQTYGRFVRFHVYFKTSTAGPEARRAEAVENHKRIGPFAVLSYVSDNAEAYLEVMQRRGVVAFGGTSGDTGVFVGRSADYFRRKPGLTWGYLPSLEQYASMYTSLICQNGVPHRTSFSGNAGQNGSPRKFGLLWSNDETFPFLETMKSIVERDVRRCGGEIVAEATFPDAGYSCCSQGNAEAGARAWADFAAKGVTTVIWPGGMDVSLSKQAAAANYFPEILLLGDGLHDTNSHGHLMDQQVWRHARIVTPKTLRGREEDEPCFQAAREGEPESERRDIISFACGFYNDIRQLFTGIQVAGPRLNPETMDKGFHAIPRKESASTRVPACFYDPGDYTCVKDAQVMWWDPETVSSGTGGASSPGCWRSVAGGRRFLANAWPRGDLGSLASQDDPCNNLG